LHLEIGIPGSWVTDYGGFFVVKAEWVLKILGINFCLDVRVGNY
jgi:hypothetical protein